MQIIIVTKHLDNNTKHLELLLCYDLMEGIIDKEEEIFLVAKLYLFTLGTITLSKPKILNIVIFGAKHYYKFWVLQLLFATEIQLHATNAIANLCSCIRQVAHDIQLHATIRMQHVYMVFIYMFIYTY